MAKRTRTREACLECEQALQLYWPPVSDLRRVERLSPAQRSALERISAERVASRADA